jgi:hypothetical protein
MCVSREHDNLFSNDHQILRHEPDLYRYLAEGRASFLDVHRRAQGLILAHLDTQGFIDDRGKKLDVSKFLDTSEVSEWSCMMVLRLVFEGLRNANDDVFSEKAKTYKESEAFYRQRAVLRVDLNNDGKIDDAEQVSVRGGMVVRR